jgi:dGTPase
MNWEILLSDRRLGQDKDLPGSQRGKVRTGFQVDYDRIVFSPAFRRLQNKTQVFPLPKSDFVRNRLTHSLETASVGRSLGNLVGERLLIQYQSLSENHSFQDFGALVSAACLAHDIGNPPFGHAGEDAISSYFNSEMAEPWLRDLTERQKADLQNFEGNAAGFRILSHTPVAQSQITGGLGLCYATYATFVKYPKPSAPSLKHTGIQSLKKFNFFDPEVAVYKGIAEHLDLNPKEIEGTEVFDRYPLAYLVEAADDICYTVIDFEDGYQMGLIPFEEIEFAFLNLIGEERINQSRYSSLLGRDVKIAYLRSKAINSLVEATAAVFLDREIDILGGVFNDSLLDHIPQAAMIDHIKRRSFDQIYSSEYIVKIEAAGYKVLPGLLDIFIPSVLDDGLVFNRKLQKLIPDAYLAADRNPFPDPYSNLLNITMYIASMTDQHAISLFRDLNGISLSGLS